MSDSLIALNRAVGGAGDGGNGGNGQGGGIFNGVPNPFGTPSLTLRRSLVVFNRADGGAAATAAPPGWARAAASTSLRAGSRSPTR